MPPPSPSISRALMTKLNRVSISSLSSLNFSRQQPYSAISTINNNSTPPPPSSSSSSSSQGESKRSSWSKWLLFLPGGITFGLGTWQIFRREDKIKMLEYRQKRLDMEPLKLDIRSSMSKASDLLEFRRVLAKGVFDDKKSIFVGPRSRSISGVTENGFYLITPLMPIPNDPDSVQSPVLVNRGWVPRSWRDKFLETFEDDEQPSVIPKSSPQKREQQSWWKFWSKQPSKVEEKLPAVTAVEVIGVVRGSENPSIFVPHNDPSSSQWFYVDVPAMARSCGVPEDTIYIEDINENVNASNPYPMPKDVNALIHSSVMPQDHLNYTLTWYSLSAAVTFMAYKRLRPNKSRR